MHLKRLGIRLPDIVDPDATAILEPSNRIVVNGQFYWTSGEQNSSLFLAAPYAYIGLVRDPVTRKLFSPTSFSPRRDRASRILYFFDEESASEFDRYPDHYVE